MGSGDSMATAARFEFSSWPPPLTHEQVAALVRGATTYALAHGLLYLPPGYPAESPAPQAAIQAPLSLLPAPFPRRLFEHAKRLQNIYNVLYARVSMDIDFLDEVMGAEKGVGRVDEFIGELWKGWKQLRDDHQISQALHLGLFRSDYLVHAPESSSDQNISLKQVEFNTISVSFGCLSQKIADLHRYQLAATSYFNASPYLKPENFPENQSIAGLAEGLATAHRAYLNGCGRTKAKILFVVQPGERNVFDQKWLEYELLEKHSILVVRQTFEELIHSASVDEETSILRISPVSSPNIDLEISVVYYRSGYTPQEYPTRDHYNIRFFLERSKSIKCPTIALQLAGGKKVQEVLGKKGVAERFLPDFAPEKLEELRESFMDMWGLDDDSEASVEGAASTAYPTVGQDINDREPSGTTKARREHASLVLKPQREGGGNNVYKEDIPGFLDKLPPQEREAWIAMRLIEVPRGVGGWLVKAGGLDPSAGIKASEAEKAVKAEVVSELGVFGWALFGTGKSDPIEEKEVGWLVRTKGKDSNEGGVATGFSVLDSVILV